MLNKLPDDVILHIIGKDVANLLPLFWHMNDGMKCVIRDNIGFLFKNIKNASIHRASFADDEIDSLIASLEKIENLDFVKIALEYFVSEIWKNDKRIHYLLWASIHAIKNNDLDFFLRFFIQTFDTFFLDRYIWSNAINDDMNIIELWINVAAQKGLLCDLFDKMTPTLINANSNNEKRHSSDIANIVITFWKYAIDEDDVLLVQKIKAVMREKWNIFRLTKRFALDSVWKCHSYEMLKQFIVEWKVPLKADFAPLTNLSGEQQKQQVYRLVDIYHKLYSDLYDVHSDSMAHYVADYVVDNVCDGEMIKYLTPPDILEQQIKSIISSCSSPYYISFKPERFDWFRSLNKSWFNTNGGYHPIFYFEMPFSISISDLIDLEEKEVMDREQNIRRMQKIVRRSEKRSRIRQKRF